MNDKKFPRPQIIPILNIKHFLHALGAALKKKIILIAYNFS